MSTVLDVPIIFNGLITRVQYTVLAVVPRVVMGRPAESVVAQNRAHGVTYEANLSSEASAFVALNEFLVNLV